MWMLDNLGCGFFSVEYFSFLFLVMIDDLLFRKAGYKQEAG